MRMMEYFTRSYHTPDDRYKPADNNNTISTSNGSIPNSIRYYNEDELTIPLPNSFMPTKPNGEITYNYYPMSSSTSSSSYQPSSDYVQQEEEWDRDALLDPMWEYQQKKTFTAWVNSHLRKAGTKIEILEEDFQNGLKLMLLLEIISGQPLPKPDRGRTRFHRIANVNKALQYIQSRGVKLVSVGAEEVVDGNVKLTLGLIWTIILRFAIQEISVGEHSARDGLLLWCQRKTEPYEDVNVQNFSTSWKDGLAFCALIHRHRPELIDYGSLDPNNHIGNLSTAFDVAEKDLDIPKMLDPEAVAFTPRPDEKSVMTYVSCFYHAFEPKRRVFPQNFPQKVRQNLQRPRMFTPPPHKSMVQVLPPIETRVMGRKPRPISNIFEYSPKIMPRTENFEKMNGFRPQLVNSRLIQPAKELRVELPPAKPDPKDLEKAANRVSRVLSQNKENKKMADDYELLADDLLKWIDHWMPIVSNRTEEPNSNGLKNRLNDFKQYRHKEKPPRIEEKSQLETLFNTLQNRLRLGNRPAFMPENGKTVKDVNLAWNNLEQSEKGFEEWLLSEMMRLQRLERLAEKFHRKCASHSQWCQGKETILKSEDYKSADVHTIKAIGKRHEAFESDMDAHQERIEQIVEIGKELTRLRYAKAKEIAEKCGEVVGNWDKLEVLAKERSERLIEAEKVAGKLDEIHLKLAKQLGPFNSWLDSVKEDLTDLVIVNQMNEIEGLSEDHLKFKETLPEAVKTLENIKTLESEAKELVEKYGLGPKLLANPYTDLSMNKVEGLWREIQQLLPERDHQLEAERARQQKNERLRDLFAEKANELGPWLEDLLEQVLSARLTSASTLESILKALGDIKHEAILNKHQLDELEKINQEMQENLVFESPKSKYTMESIRVGWESLMTSLNKVSNEFENQILLRDSKGLSHEQLKEYRQAFAHFDKDSKGLNEEQLKAFLISIGHAEDPYELFLKLDSNSMGTVSFDAILDHLTREQTDRDNAEQMIEAFRLLANGKSAITEQEIRSELPPKLAEYCLQELDSFHDPSDKGFDYETFCKNIFIQ